MTSLREDYKIAKVKFNLTFNFELTLLVTVNYYYPFYQILCRFARE